MFCFGKFENFVILASTVIFLELHVSYEVENLTVKISILCFVIKIIEFLLLPNSGDIFAQV